MTSKFSRVLAATQFSPADGRSAFPCFDEPRFKATFNVSLYRRPSATAMSNMPLSVSTPMYVQDLLHIIQITLLIFFIHYHKELIIFSYKMQLASLCTFCFRKDGWILDEFTTTPVMSPYLVAFIVSDYFFINVTYDERVNVSNYRIV